MVPTGNKAKCLLLTNHTTKTIYHHHHHHHHHQLDSVFHLDLFSSIFHESLLLNHDKSFSFPEIFYFIISTKYAHPY